MDVLQFPKEGPASWVRVPADRVESGDASSAGIDDGSVSTAKGRAPADGEEPGSGGRAADVAHAGRVFRVVWCPKCDWQYGAWWPRAEVYGYWGDCLHCGAVTQVRTSYSPTYQGAKVSAKSRRVAVGAQTELGI